MNRRTFAALIPMTALASFLKLEHTEAVSQRPYIYFADYLGNNRFGYFKVEYDAKQDNFFITEAHIFVDHISATWAVEAMHDPKVPVFVRHISGDVKLHSEAMIIDGKFTYVDNFSTLDDEQEVINQMRENYNGFPVGEFLTRIRYSSFWVKG